MIMKMIAHALSVKRTESIVITGMHDFVVHSVGGKMAEKNHHGAMIVTLGIFKRYKKLYEKDFYLVLTAVVGQDYGKHMILHGAYNVTDVVLPP